MSRVKAYVWAARRETVHRDLWGKTVMRPGQPRTPGGLPAHLTCTSLCYSFWVYAYRITIDGVVMKSDNARSWDLIFQTAHREALLFAHLMGDVTCLRRRTVTVGSTASRIGVEFDQEVPA